MNEEEKVVAVAAGTRDVASGDSTGEVLACSGPTCAALNGKADEALPAGELPWPDGVLPLTKQCIADRVANWLAKVCRV